MFSAVSLSAKRKISTLFQFFPEFSLIFHEPSWFFLNFSKKKFELEGDWKSWKSGRLGNGIYPALALLNHSCDPNIAKYFDGSTVVAVASRTIFKGEYNFITYAFFLLGRSWKTKLMRSNNFYLNLRQIAIRYLVALPRKVWR